MTAAVFQSDWLLSALQYTATNYVSDQLYGMYIILITFIVIY